jgi:hypothetical protein
MSVQLTSGSLSGSLWPKHPTIRPDGVVLRVDKAASARSDTSFTAVCFSPADPHCFIAADAAGNVLQFSLIKNRFALIARMPAAVNSMAFVNEKNLLACATGMSVVVVNTETAKTVAKLRGPHQNHVFRVASPSLSRGIAVTLSKECIAVWNVADQLCLTSKRRHFADVAVAPDNFYTVETGGSVRMWSAASFAETGGVKLNGHRLRCVTTSADYVVIGTHDPTLLLLQPGTLQPMWVVAVRTAGHAVCVTSLTRSLQASMHADGVVSVMATTTAGDGALAVGQSLQLRVTNQQVPVAFAASGDTYAAVVTESQLFVYHLPTAKIAFDKLANAEAANAERQTVLPFVSATPHDVVGALPTADETDAENVSRSVVKPAMPPPSDDAVKKQWIKVNLLNSAERGPVSADAGGPLFVDEAVQKRFGDGSSANVNVSHGTARHNASELHRDAMARIGAANAAASKKKKQPLRASQFEDLSGFESAVSMRSLLDDRARVVNVDKLRASLMRFGVFPERFRPLIWRFLLQLPDKHAAAPHYALLANRGIHPGVASLMKPFPLPDNRQRHVLERALSALAYQAPVFAVAHFVPSIAFPFVNVFGSDVQSTVEAVLAFHLNWGQEFFVLYPHMPVGVASFVSHTLKAEDPALWQHLHGLGVTAEVFVWEVMVTLYTEVMTKNEWLQFMDHVVANEPVWMFLFHVRWLCQLRLPLLAIADHSNVVALLRRATPFDMNAVLQQTYRLHQRYARNEVTAPYEALAVFPAEGYPSHFQNHESVVVTKLQELELIAEHEAQLKGSKVRTAEIERRLTDAAMLEDAFVGRQRALAAAKFDVTRIEPRDLDQDHPGIEVHCLTRRAPAA